MGVLVGVVGLKPYPTEDFEGGLGVFYIGVGVLVGVVGLKPYPTEGFGGGLGVFYIGVGVLVGGVGLKPYPTEDFEGVFIFFLTETSRGATCFGISPTQQANRATPINN